MSNRGSGKTCKFEGCGVYDNGGGLCAGHWRQRSLGQELRPILRTPEERFWSRVEKGAPDECWNWTGAHNKDGHGKFVVGNRKSVYVHRYSYEQSVGPIPEGKVIDHQCRNPRCVNPGHLKAVTQAENCQNLGVQRNNKSGYRNVHRVSKSQKWGVCIGFQGKRLSFGTYDTPEEANEAAIRKRRELYTNSVMDQEND